MNPDTPTAVQMTGHDSGILGRAWGPMPALYWIAIVVFSSALFLFALGDKALTEHEMYVAGIARQMIEEGGWGVPRIADFPWLEKPPLAQWLAGLSFVVTGTFSEFTARLPTAIAGVALAVVTGWLAARIYGARVGLLGGLMVASSFPVLRYARLAETDIYLVLLVASALAAFYSVADKRASGLPPSRAPVIAFWCFAGLVNLAKTPLFGAALIGVTIAAWLLWTGQWRVVRDMFAPLWILVAVVICIAWPAYIVAVGLGPEFTDELYRHFIMRAAGGMNDKPFWYYLPFVAIYPLPWTPLVVIGAWHAGAAGILRRSAADCLLLCWTIAPVALLSMSAGKSHHYLLSTMPAYAILAACGLDRLLTWYRGAPDRTLRHIGWASAGTGVAMVAAAWWASYRFEPYAPAIVMIGLTLAAASVIGGLALMRRLIAASTAAMFVAVLVIASLMRVPPFVDEDAFAADRDFLRRAESHVPPGRPIVATGGPDITRFLFYLRPPVNTAWLPMDVTPRDYGEWPAYVVARSRFAKDLEGLGEVTVVDESAHVDSGRDISDRLTLYRVDPTGGG